MTASALSSIPRADLRSRLEAMDDPQSRQRTKIYPTPHGMPVVHEYEVASAAALMDAYQGATYGDIQAAASGHLRESEAGAARSLRAMAGLGLAALGSVAAVATGAVPGPVGVVLAAASMVGTVVAAHRYEVHDAAAQDDRRLADAMKAAGEAILADAKQGPQAA